jgi:site-specific recombinase XerD
MDLRDAGHQYAHWLSATRSPSPHTLRAYGSDIAAFERHIAAHPPTGQLDRESLLGFLESQRQAGLAPNSVKRRASAVRGFCRWLHARGWLDTDPWVGITVSSGRARRLPRVVPGGDLEKLLGVLCEGVDTRDVPDAAGLRQALQFTTLLGVALMIATAVRVNELVQIRCEEIDVAAGRVRVLGKGSRERHVFLTNAWLVELVCGYLTLRRALDISHERLLFNSHGAPLTAAAMRSRLAKAARAAGVPGKVTPHMLRHSAATRLLEAGVDIRVIQRLLGHASLSTTEIYTHVSDRALQRTVTDADILGAMLLHR